MGPLPQINIHITLPTIHFNYYTSRTLRLLDTLRTVDCVTFPLPLITAFVATVDDRLTRGGGRAVERDSETWLAEEVNQWVLYTYSTIRIGSQNIAHILEIMLSCIVNNNVSELRSVFVPACRSVLCLNCQMNANLLHFRSIDTFYVHHNTS